MKRVLAGTAAAVCVALVASWARADPRDIAGPPEPLTPDQVEARRVATVADMETWLRRLVGYYTYSGTEEVPPSSCTTNAFGMDNPRNCSDSQPREAYGVWDCVGIGAGAGVNCVFGSTAPLRVADDVSAVSSLNMDSPTMILFGIDPDVPMLRYMRIDDDGIAYEATGNLRGNTASFRKQCTHGGVSSCLEIFRIEVREDKPPQVIIDWVDAGADYNSIALLQIWMRTGVRGAGKDGERGRVVGPGQ